MRQLAGLSGLHVHEKWKRAGYTGISSFSVTPQAVTRLANVGAATSLRVVELLGTL